MARMGVVAGCRAGLGLLALASVAYGFASRAYDYDAVNYFSYFTILSNTIGGAALLAAALPRCRGRAGCDRLRGAAALYLVITGVVFALLLGGDTSDWADWVQHRIMPLAASLDWLLIAPARRLPPVPTIARWLAFPLTYLAYILVHGAFTSWYPYPFLNVVEYGYEVVAANALAIAGGFVALSTALITSANLRTRPDPAPRSTAGAADSPPAGH